MQRICIELTRFYSQSAKCVYSSLPITSDVQSSKFSSLNFHENISKKKHNVNIRGVSTNIAPAVEKEKQWVKIKFIKADGNIIEAQGKKGDSLLDILNNNNIHIEGFGACEGTLACSTCHVIFKEDDYKRLEFFPGDEEQDMLDLASGLTDLLPDVQCISFAGCGFLASYLIGAAQCLENQTQILKQVPICGASAGALLAAGLVCEIPTAILKQRFSSTAIEAQQKVLGAFSPAFNVVDSLTNALSVLPPDAHHRANGRLFISITRAKDLKNVIVSNWESREELINCLLCSCFIPGFSGTKLPTFRGEKFMDGGFTNNLPIVKEPCLTISPFASTCEICPRDSLKNPIFIKQGNHYFACTPENVVRFSRSLFVPSTDVLNALYLDGFRQMDLYLKLKHKPDIVEVYN